MRIILAGILFNVEMSLRLFFGCFKKRLGLIRGQEGLLFSQPLLSFLFKSLLEIRLKVVEHVLILDSQIVQASSHLLFLLHR